MTFKLLIPGDYSPTPSSLIGALAINLGISVRNLSKDKEEDLRDNTSVGGLNLFLNSTASGGFCVLREALAAMEAILPRLLEQCSDVSYQFLVARVT